MSTCPVLDQLFGWASTAPNPSLQVVVTATSLQSPRGGKPTVYTFSGRLEYSNGGVYHAGKYALIVPPHFTSGIFGKPPLQEQMNLQISAPLPSNNSYSVLLAPNPPTVGPLDAGSFVPFSGPATENPAGGLIYGYMPLFHVEIDMNNANPG
jgi:hypothetical protein